MYKCNSCGALFEQPDEEIKKGDYFDNPFGFGGYYEADKLVSGCPECGCEDFRVAWFNGYSCPQCDEELDDDSEEKNHDFVCKKCGYITTIVNGKWIEE